MSAQRGASPLCLLHGWGMNAAVFESLSRQAGARPCTPLHLPGHGPAPVLAPLPRSRRTSLAAHWRDAVAARLPRGATLLAWSLGALIALLVALQHPARVRRLILVSATPCFTRRRGWTRGIAQDSFDDFCWRLAQDPAAALAEFNGLQTFGDAHRREVQQALAAAMAAAPAPDPVALKAGLELLRATDLRAQLHRIRAPTLVIHGARDPVVPHAAGLWLARAIRGARYVALPRAAHAPFLSEPPAFLRALDGFLEEA